MSISVTNKTHQFAAVCLSADVDNVQKIALGLAGKMAFDQPIATSQNDPATHYWAAAPCTAGFAAQVDMMKLAVANGQTPPPAQGEWADYGIADVDVAPVISRMLISAAPKGYSKIEQVDALLAGTGLERITPEN